MKTLTLYFATNRDPIGDPPKDFGTKFNPVHPHELRFGEIKVEIQEKLLQKEGTALAEDLSKTKLNICLYGEKPTVEGQNKRPKLGSLEMFDSLKGLMADGCDTLIFIHGYAVKFSSAVGAALALQEKLQQEGVALRVILFTWPSDGSNVYSAYKSDRNDASASGAAFSRGILKLRDFLLKIPREGHCGHQIHLLCHSMGNFVLESTLRRLQETSPGRLPRILGEAIHAAADVDDDAFEHDHKLKRLPELARRVSVYFNRGDLALAGSDITKGNPVRLGAQGPKHPLDVPSGVVLVDSSDVVDGLAEHSYFLDAPVRKDIAETLKCAREDRVPRRDYVSSSNSYRLKG